MYKHKLIAVSMILGSSLLPCISNAEAAAPSTSTPAATPAPDKTQATVPTTSTATEDNTANEMTKEKWLDTIVPMLPSLICKGFMNDPELKQRLETIKMSYDQCVSAVPESVNKCKSQLSSNIPEKITTTDASTWGKALGECIGKDFAMKYLIPK